MMENLNIDIYEKTGLHYYNSYEYLEMHLQIS